MSRLRRLCQVSLRSTVLTTSLVVVFAGTSLAQADPTLLGEERGPLAAGTYADTSTGPSVVFTVGDGWAVSGEPLPEVGTELAPDGFPGIVTLTTFDGTVFSQPCAKKGRVDKLLKKTRDIETSAASYIEAMATHANLVAQDPVETQLGGYPALQLDVVARTGKNCDPRRAFLWALPVVREFHLNDGSVARIIAADVEDEVVIAFIETPARASASPFTFLDRAMELVESIEITPAETLDDSSAAADATDSTAADE